MKKKILITLLFAILIVGSLFAQPVLNPRPRNTISLSLVGNGAAIAINYDRITVINRNVFTSFQIGTGIGYSAELFSPSSRFPVIPHVATLNLGGGGHFFEVGIGGTIAMSSSISIPYVVYPTVGYRLQPLDTRGLYLRLFSSLPLNDGGGRDIFPGASYLLFFPFGLSLGSSF